LRERDRVRGNKRQPPPSIAAMVKWFYIDLLSQGEYIFYACNDTAVFIRHIQGLKGIADYRGLQVEVIKEWGRN
jgi:hypothetical protein